jgi:5-methylcytosine-specific restriction endonuclease McrA
MTKWRRDISNSKRWTLNAVINRDGNYCYLCHKLFDKKGDMTIDHVVPTSLGGTDDIQNLKLAHEDCNRKKADMTLEEFKQENKQ